MADAMDTLKGLLGDNAEDKIKSAMDMLSGSGTDLPSDDSMEYLMQMKDIAQRLTAAHSDPRTNLLFSLKPYMRQSRQTSIDNAVKILNIVKLAKLFKL